MEQDSRIDTYIEAAAPFAGPILRHLRELVHATVPDLGETLKWGMPHFTHNGKYLAGFAAFKTHAAFMIHANSRQGEGMGQFGKIATLADLPPDEVLKARLLAACDRLDSGNKRAAPKSGPVMEIGMPDDLASTLSPLSRQFLDGLAPSYRQEYFGWITEAKREETRARRIAQAAEWLAEGKKRNWKYDAC